MFTGIVESTAKIIEKTPMGITVERPQAFTDLKIGSSVSVSGVCLSVVELTETEMRFDVIEETLKKTTIGEWKKGDRVNLERAMKMGERMDGHVVQGHVEGVGRVASFELRVAVLTVQISENLARGVQSKGSIAIDGVSLTVAKREGNEVTIALIPHTLENTTLGSLMKGDWVNVETDVMVRAGRANYPDHPKNS